MNFLWNYIKPRDTGLQRRKEEIMNTHNCVLTYLYLHNEGLIDLYVDGMTPDQAELAARRDPRYIERSVRMYLNNEGLIDLYVDGMTLDQAELAVQAERARQ